MAARCDQGRATRAERRSRSFGPGFLGGVRSLREMPSSLDFLTSRLASRIATRLTHAPGRSCLETLFQDANILVNASCVISSAFSRSPTIRYAVRTIEGYSARNRSSKVFSVTVPRAISPTESLTRKLFIPHTSPETTHSQVTQPPGAKRFTRQANLRAHSSY